MADLKPKRIGALLVINDNAALTDGSRAAGDATTGNKGNASWADAYLTIQFDTTAPAAGSTIAELYVVPGDGDASQVFPEGGDAGLGSNVDPQKSLLVGVFETRDPSTSVDEILIIRGIQLGIGTDRFVIKNVSGQTFDLTWQLDLVFWTYESV